MGITDEAGLKRIQSKRIAIGGLGLGGSVLINLIRMGFEDFHVGDPDTYERTNIGRQRQAKESTVGKRKDLTLIAEAKDINPNVRIRAFSEGVKPSNLGQFLEGVDWAVDVVDVFAMKDKLGLNEGARQRGIPLVSGGSLGFSGYAVAFDHQGPSFAELSGISEKNSGAVNFRNFLQFLAPQIPPYMLQQLTRSLDGSTHVPFAVPGVEISAALIASHISNAVLGLNKPVVAPQGTYFDAIKMLGGTFEADHRVREYPGLGQIIALPKKKAA
jgi:molybdopterin/thiamine biosynthesis adenylyltransferase